MQTPYVLRKLDNLLREYAEYQQFVWRNEGKNVILQRNCINNA